MVRRAEDAGSDALELNFGCPHGMSERGMGSAVGQVPEYTSMITEWVKEVARTPLLVKLTPNISDIRVSARAARKGGADAVSAINTINSITGVDLDTFTPRPDVGGKSAHGGYCGPAVKPIALHMVEQIASDPQVQLPISAIGGVSGWREAAEFILLGAGSIQACTAPMHFGYRIVEDMIDGLSEWMDSKAFRTLDDFRGRSLSRVTAWQHLDLNFKIVARIHPEKCIGCQLCYTACWDGAHQCIHVEGFEKPEHEAAHDRAKIVSTPTTTTVSRATPPSRIPKVDEHECVGCNLCWLVCPVENCISMERVDSGKQPQSWAERTQAVTQ
jgi:dihydropyrimidine dehydrogenase (NAD+) subunit PreA